MTYFLIYNKTSGKRNSRRYVAQIRKVLKENGDKVYVLSTEYKGHAKVLCRKIADKYDDKAVVIIFGGDGTVSEAAGGLVNSNTPMMLIPCGSGNDFAKKIYGKSFTVDKVLSMFGFANSNPQYNVSRIDTITANEHVCLNVLSTGFDTQVETVAHKLLRKFSFLGKRAYDLAVLMCLPGKLKYDYRIKAYKNDELVLDNDELSIILMALCNASYYGGGYCPAPEASMSDGILDLVYVDPVTIPRIAKLIGPYKQGKASAFKEIHQFEVTEIKLSAKEGKTLYNCDGENYLEDSVSIRVNPQSLSLCIPT